MHAQRISRDMSTTNPELARDAYWRGRRYARGMINPSTLPLLLVLALCVVLIGFVLSMLILRAVIKSAVLAALRESALELRKPAALSQSVSDQYNR